MAECLGRAHTECCNVGPALARWAATGGSRFADGSTTQLRRVFAVGIVIAVVVAYRRSFAFRLIDSNERSTKQLLSWTNLVI